MLIRVGVCIQAEVDRHKVESWLKQIGAMVLSLQSKDFIETIGKEPLDLLVFSEESLKRPIALSLEKIFAQNKTADMVFLSGKQRYSAETSELIAGRAVVLPGSSSWKVVVETLQNLIDKRLDLKNSFSRRQNSEKAPSLNDFLSDIERVEPFVAIARKVMHSDSSLLILGETGVGKEWLARAIHLEGARRSGPFVPVNCAALPDNLLESELFGHEQGAFTGAIRARRGAFELSHKGTIFLDEIGDMPWHLQAKLLRVLQDKEFQKVGGEKTIKVDVRIVAATNHNLELLVEQRKFRKDLYYRLGVVAIEIPPLRERPHDIPALVERVIDGLNMSGNANIVCVEPEAMKALVAYKWPGNVRELMNVLERAVLLGSGRSIGLEDLPVEMTGYAVNQAVIPQLISEENSNIFKLKWKESRAIVLKEYEKRYFEILLRRYQGKVSVVAKAAGISPRALHQKMIKHKIRKEDFRK